MPTGELLGSPRSSTAPASRTSRSPAAASSTAPSGAGSRAPGSGSGPSRPARRRRSAMALRGRFLVGSRPVGADFARRFVASAAESGIDVFRLHDPLNDVSNLREAGEAITSAEREFDAGPRLRLRAYGRDRSSSSSRRRSCLSSAPSRDPAPRPVRLPRAAPRARARRRAARGERPAGRALLPGRCGQRARVGARGGSRGRRPRRLRRLSDRADAAPRLRRGARAARSPASAWTPASTSTRSGSASDLVDEYIGDEPVTPARAAGRRPRGTSTELPPGLVAALDTHLRAQAAGDRLDEVLEELLRIREEAGWPPLAAPIGQILASQALLNVLSASRYQTVVDELRALVSRPLRRPARADRPGASQRAVELVSGDGLPRRSPVDLDAAARARRRASRRARRSCSCSRSSATRPSRCCEAIRGRHTRRRLARRERRRPGACRADPRARPDRPGVGRRRGRDRGGRHARLGPAHAGSDRAGACRRRDPPRSAEEALPVAAAAPADGVIRVESPMVGTFYRAPQPGAPPFVEEGDAVGAGQTLCILEAMKLMNEVKADVEGVVRAIHVENAEPVEFGQLLFELEPVIGARSTRSSRCSRASSSPTAARSPSASSGRCTSSGSRPSRSTRPPTRTRCTCGSPTGRSASARRRRPRATCASRP